MHSNRNWQQKLADALTLDGRVPSQVVTRAAGSDNAALVTQLREAGMRFARRARQDDFAVNSAEACVDIAKRVEQRGEFASPKQQEYAMKLIAWSLPREQKIYSQVDAPQTAPKLFAVLQKHTHFYADPLKLSRKNQDTLVWIVWHGAVVGKIENANVVIFRKAGDDVPVIAKLIAEFESDPLEAAKKYGKLSGRCCSCGRDLTDPESIEAGIGPVCATRF